MVKTVKEELSEDRKLASIESWASKLGMDAKGTRAVLVEKYGPFAYDVMEAAMMRPSVLMKNVGGKAKNSKEAVDYFIKHIVSNEDLAKVVGKDARLVETEIAAYRVKHPLLEETAEQRELKERQEQFNQRFNEEMGRNNGGAELAVDPTKIDISKMTLEDYAKYCRPEDKPAESYNDLLEKAFEDFGKGEGVIKGLYLDSKGYPTIGNGHLVLHEDYLKNPKQLKAAQEAYAAIPLIGANGKPLTREQKIIQFKQIEQAMRAGTFKTSGGCPNYVKVPATGKLNDAGIKHIFTQDFAYAYKKTKQVVPNIDEMPLPVQLAVLHATFAYGNANRLKGVDVNSPAEVMKKVDKDRNRKGTSRGERDTIKWGTDSVRTAERNYQLEQFRLQQGNVQDGAQVLPEANTFDTRLALIQQRSGRIG